MSSFPYSSQTVRRATAALPALLFVLVACGQPEPPTSPCRHPLPASLAAPGWGKKADLEAWVRSASEGQSTIPVECLVDAAVRLRHGRYSRGHMGLDALLGVVGEGLTPDLWLRLLQATDRTADAWQRAEVIQSHLDQRARHEDEVARQALVQMANAGVSHTVYLAPHIDGGRELAWQIALDTGRTPETRVDALITLGSIGTREDLPQLRALEVDTTEFYSAGGGAFAGLEMTLGRVARESRERIQERLGGADR